MSHTFIVSEKNVAHFYDIPANLHFIKHQQLYNEKKGEYESRLKGETVYASDIKVVGGPSPLFHAVAYAFNNHCPLVLTPDSVWLTILVGLSHHIDSNPEGLRHHFVQHQGQILLEVHVDSPPLPNIPPHVWEYGIGQFSEKIKDHIGKKHDLVVCNFSTTQKNDLLSSQIAIMGALKHYFKYKMLLCCGLSRVTVEGTPDDWANIYQRVQALTEFDLGWWTEHLLPVIQQLQHTCEGKPDIDFWKRIYIYHGKGSGGEHDVSGWVNVFHPYIAGNPQSNYKMRRNPWVNWHTEYNSDDGIDKNDFPSGVVCAPVLLVDHYIPYDFEFYGGLVGVTMNPQDYTVQPVSGIAIQNLGLTQQNRDF